MYANASLPIWLEELLADKDKNMPILDIGCGFGQSIVALQKAGFTNVRGIDVSEKAVAYCRYKNLPVTLMDVNEYQGEKMGGYYACRYLMLNQIQIVIGRMKISRTIRCLQQAACCMFLERPALAI